MPRHGCHLILDMRMSFYKRKSKYFIIFLIFMHNSSEGKPSVNRCTRRFTPGYCEGPVKPVWTFVFQIQKCVMRMGCPPSIRNNRYRQYSQCVKSCKTLVDLYTQILLLQNADRAGPPGSPRRDIDGTPYLRTSFTDYQDDESYGDDAPEIPTYDIDGTDSLGDIVQNNIDGDTEVHSFLDTINENT